MRRPLCFASLVFAVTVAVLLMLMPPQAASYEAYDGRSVTLTGRVAAKEFKTGSDGTISLAVTLKHISVEESPGTIRPPDAEPPSENAVPNAAPRPGVFPFPTDDGRAGVLCIFRDGEASPESFDNGIPIGSYLKVRGKLQSFPPASNPGEFDSHLYYQILHLQFRLNRTQAIAISKTTDPLGDRLYRLKRSLSHVLESCFTDEDADILKAMILGEKGFLSAELKDLYQQSGIIHILAISGLHISLFGMGLYRLLRKCRVPPPAAAVLAVTMMILYGKMTGMNSSSFRAVFMFIMHMTAMMLHRTYDLLTATALAGMLLLIEQPLYLYHSGFLFSFGAVLAIAILMPVLPCKTGGILAVPLANLPVYLSFYCTFPLYSLVLNLLVIPLMTGVMASGFGALVIGCFSAAAGSAAGLPCHCILYFYKAICSMTAALPGSRLILGHPYPWETAVYFAMLFALVLFSTEYEDKIFERRHAADRFTDPIADRRLARRIAAGKCIWTAAAVLILCIRFSDGLRLHFLDVGQGDGIYIESDGYRVTIDGGSSSKTEVAKYQIRPFLQYEAAGIIDLAILTHDDSDHCNGLIALLEDGYAIRQIALASLPESAKGENYRRVEALAAQRRIPVLYLHRGEKITRGKLTLWCVHPGESAEPDAGAGKSGSAKPAGAKTGGSAKPAGADAGGSGYEDVNEGSLTFLLTYGNFSAMLTGDLEKQGEQDCLVWMQEQQMVREITVLKAGHHGSKYATSAGWLSALQPAYAVISCGKNNRYGHPNPAVLERLEEAGAEILDTREGGEIEFRTDGKT
jgi:competence protein ComEC